VSKEYRPGENWVQYKLAIKGSSGKLNTTLIGDFLNHEDLQTLEQERKEYFENKAAELAAKKPEKSKEVEEKSVIEADYVPIDF